MLTKPYSLLFLILSVFLLSSCNQPGMKTAAVGLTAQDSSLTLLRNLNDNLTESVVDDGFSPPVASRIYTYPNIAFYEVIRYLNPELHTMSGRLNGLSGLPTPDTTLAIDYRIAASEAFTVVALELVYRDNLIAHKNNQMQGFYYQEFNDSTIFNQSVAFGKEMGKSILGWMSKDNYKETRTMPKHPVSYKPGRWVPTAPAYGEAIEPHFMKLRPMTLDSCSQYKPVAPVPFSTDKNSFFYKEAMKVYEAVNNLNDSTIGIARHWDCNPIPSTVIGHLKYVRRQLTPGGHWMWITAKVSQDKNLKLSEASYIQMLVSVGLIDAFMACWDEKFKSDRIRPETYIKDNIDKNWKPFLETPLFPEYISGHSTVSASASVILTNFFGENVAFTDSAELDFGLPVRKFNSFYEASDEALISRFLGGIHYMDACVEGKNVGTKVGENVLRKLGNANTL